MKTRVIYCVVRRDGVTVLETDVFDHALAVFDTMPDTVVKVRLERHQ